VHGVLLQNKCLPAFSLPAASHHAEADLCRWLTREIGVSTIPPSALDNDSGEQGIATLADRPMTVASFSIAAAR